MTDGREKPKAKRGFASIPAERRREIAAMGGKAVPNNKRSFAKSPELAAAAGKKGGEAVPSEHRTFTRYPDLARGAGKKGGSAPKKSGA